MEVVQLAKQDSLVSQYLSEIRDAQIQKDSLRFRRNIERIGECMAFEISKCLDYGSKTIQTPIAPCEVRVPQDRVVLGTILRAGLPLHQGFLNMMDGAENAFLSAYRKTEKDAQGKEHIQIVSEYLAAPSIEGKTLILVDPMLATGMSMEVAYQALLSHGMPKKVFLASVIGSEQAVAHLQQTMPKGTTLFCAAIDPQLNDHKYIVPGLGDAGDLCFGDKL